MKRALTAGLRAGLAWASAAASRRVVGGAAAGGYYVGKDDRSADRIAADAAITADVKARLIGEPGIRSLSDQCRYLQRQCQPEG